MQTVPREYYTIVSMVCQGFFEIFRVFARCVQTLQTFGRPRQLPLFADLIKSLDKREDFCYNKRQMYAYEPIPYTGGASKAPNFPDKRS